MSFALAAFSAVLLYLFASFNRFSSAHGRDLAPCDVAVGSPLSKDLPPSFESTVLAELPICARLVV